MNSESPLISVCIPSYNRPEYIGDMLDTVIAQSFDDFEVVICEDNSPKTLEIEKIVTRCSNERANIVVRFIRNQETLGYDGNFRKLIEVSKGQYCVFMGDDDLMCENALSRIADVVNDKAPGVIIRSWARADRETKEVQEFFRYFDSDRSFKSGDDAIVTMFRRSVAIAGYTVKRSIAIKYATDQFDGTLLYQLYLTGMILSETNGYYISDIIAIMRKDSSQLPTHFFGTAKAERSLFEPGKLGTENSLNFFNGMIGIAKFLEIRLEKPGLYGRILKDIGSYSYPFLAVHSSRSIREFGLYYLSLSKKGLWRSFYFHLYFVALIIFGRTMCERIIVFIKKYLKRTPILGSITSGDKV